ncbi:MAG: Lipid biosynthesis acyltransferase [Pedosphaera sp.]|nr:Lipid biosynthesis acyltransferase [Pedosphaera sp.]
MDQLLYYIARGLISFLQSLPVTWVARIGRAGGALAFWLDARHRKVTINNLTNAFGREKSPAEIYALAKENFRRIGENFACAAKTASMTYAQLQPHMEIVGDEKLFAKGETTASISRVFAIGHFGNFEIFAHSVQKLPGFQGATTYRALKSPALNRLLLSLREQSGCLFFERRMDGAALRAATRDTHLILGFLSDQHAGDGGMRIPFFGQDCSTTKAPAVFALRYGLPLHTAICYRTRLGHWRIEVSDEIPVQENGQPRSSEAIMLDVNRAFEIAVRRDPANWFWVHKRWKPARSRAVAAPKPKLESQTELIEGEDAV